MLTPLEGAGGEEQEEEEDPSHQIIDLSHSCSEVYLCCINCPRASWQRSDLRNPAKSVKVS